MYRGSQAGLNVCRRDGVSTKLSPGKPDFCTHTHTGDASIFSVFFLQVCSVGLSAEFARTNFPAIWCVRLSVYRMVHFQQCARLSQHLLVRAAYHAPRWSGSLRISYGLGTHLCVHLFFVKVVFWLFGAGGELCGVPYAELRVQRVSRFCTGFRFITPAADLEPV